MITEEAVEVAAKSLYRMSFSTQALLWDGTRAHPAEQRAPGTEDLERHAKVQEMYRSKARAMLEAAEPHLTELGVPVIASRERVAAEIRSTFRDGTTTLCTVTGIYEFVDALLAAGVFREPPTQADLAAELGRHRRVHRDPALGGGWVCSCSGWPQGQTWNEHTANVVLTLLGGEAG